MESCRDRGRVLPGHDFARDRDGGAAWQRASRGRRRMDDRRGRNEADPHGNPFRFRGRRQHARSRGWKMRSCATCGLSLRENMDRAIFVGDDGANPNAGDITGLFDIAGLEENEISQTNKVLWPGTIEAFTDSDRWPSRRGSGRRASGGIGRGHAAVAQDFGEHQPERIGCAGSPVERAHVADPREHRDHHGRR